MSWINQINLHRTIILLVVIGGVVCEKNSLDASYTKDHIQLSVRNSINSLETGLRNFSSNMKPIDAEVFEQNNGTSLVEGVKVNALEVTAQRLERKPQPNVARAGIGLTGTGHGGAGHGGGGPGGGGHGGGGHGGLGGNRKRKKKQKKQQGLIQKILPLMIVPFMVSTAIIPVMIFIIKMLLMKAAFVAKIAVALGLLNMLRRRGNNGGVYNHNALKMR